MDKRKYTMFTMIIIGILSIFEWGISFSSIFLIASMFFIYINFIIKDLCVKNISLKKFYYIYKTMIIIFISSFILVEGMIIFNINEGENITNIDNIDTMIVLGARLDGDKVSNTLKLRLDKAIEYYNKHKNINIIVSGGKTNSSDISEALAMENYLIANGVNKNNIIKEDKATSTLENIIYSKKILEDINYNGKVLIVTSDFHLFRGRLIASILGIENKGICSKSELSKRIYYMIKEYPASIRDLLRSTVYRYTHIS